MTNFWQKLKKPFTVLAPMDEVTDVVFRQMVAETAPPDVFFTEFVNCEALQSAGRTEALKRLQYTKDQRPIVAQIWGKNPDNFFKSAQLIKDLGFDGIDINMGCPDKAVIKIGTGSALINDRTLAKELIDATKLGAKDLPVSVKTRLGFREAQIEDWIGFLLKLDLAALTVHGRTVKEMSKVPAHWDEIGKVVKLRDLINRSTLIIGNGDVENMEEVENKSRQYGVDGVMIGRGVLHNIYVFSKIQPSFLIDNNQIQNQLNLVLRHIELFEKTWGETKQFQILKKFFKVYISGFEGAVDLRKALMEAENIQEVRKVVINYRKQVVK